MVTLEIRRGDDRLFETGFGENVLVPLDPDERAEVFAALAGAMALLAGVTPPGGPAMVSGHPATSATGKAAEIVVLADRRQP